MGNSPNAPNTPQPDSLDKPVRSETASSSSSVAEIVDAFMPCTNVSSLTHEQNAPGQSDHRLEPNANSDDDITAEDLEGIVFYQFSEEPAKSTDNNRYEENDEDITAEDLEDIEFACMSQPTQPKKQPQSADTPSTSNASTLTKSSNNFDPHVTPPK